MWKPGFSFVFNFSLDDYGGECIPAARNYAGSGFVLQLYIGLDNGKGMAFIKYYRRWILINLFLLSVVFLFETYLNIFRNNKKN